ncbi:MAG: hypothetical protein ACW98I_08795 [Candidatus Hodarchaeales archaeon]|jgi:hypothetical protein
MNDIPPKLTPKRILEGTRLTKKTEIAFKLKVSGNPSQYDELGIFFEEQNPFISRSIIQYFPT